MASDDFIVSIIITTYYRNSLLVNAIKSALDQTLDSVEIIIVDGSGDAHARPVAEQYPKATYIPLAGNSSPHAARNVGLTHASGSYIQFLDDDDELDPRKLACQLSNFSTTTGVVYSGFRSSSGNKVVLPDEEVRGDVLKEMLRFDKRPLDPCYTCTMLIDREVLDQIIPLQNCHAADDLGMRIELALRTEFDFVSEPLVVRRLNSVDSLGQSEANVISRLALLKQYADIYEQYPRDIRRSVLENTYRLHSSRLLADRMWSPKVPPSYLRAAYYSKNDRFKLIGLAMASLFGAPGVHAASQIYDQFR